MNLSKIILPSALIALVSAATTIACTADSSGEQNGQTSSRIRNAPPGNNGTVKIQEAGAADEIPDNDPHVGCAFNIEFRGFDEGDLHATYTLSAHPPTGNGTVLAEGSTFIGGDAAGGAVDLDGIVTVDLASLDLSGLERHPQQGYHLKLDVHAEGSIGADTKHKVFWVDGCTATPDAGTPPVVEVDAGSTSSSSSSGSSGKTW